MLLLRHARKEKVSKSCFLFIPPVNGILANQVMVTNNVKGFSLFFVIRGIMYLVLIENSCLILWRSLWFSVDELSNSTFPCESTWKGGCCISYIRKVVSVIFRYGKIIHGRYQFYVKKRWIEIYYFCIIMLVI